MAVNVEADTPLAQAIMGSIQPKLIDYSWVAEESDTSLADYVLNMIISGKTREQFISELGTDLLGVGEDDPSVTEFVDWLFQQVPALHAQLSGQQEAPQEVQMDDAVPSSAPSGPKAMRDGAGGRGRGRMLGQLNRHMDRASDDKILRIKGAAGGAGRINSHAGRDNRRGRGGANGMRGGARGGAGGPGGLPIVSPQQQMQLMQMMEMQSQMMAQIMNGQTPEMNGFNPMQQSKGRSLFDRVNKGGTFKNDGASDIEMGEDGKRSDPFDTVCRFNDKCTVPTCPYAHQSPSAPAGTAIDMTDRCSFGAACENRKCAGKHPSPAQRRAHLSQEVDCKFYPNCTNPACPFKHPDMPPCRNGADCTTAGCKFSHSKIMCRYNPCLNPGCVYKHVDGQKRGKFEDKVWTKDNNGTADRLKSLGEHQEQTEELIIPGQPEQATEIIT